MMIFVLLFLFIALIIVCSCNKEHFYQKPEDDTGVYVQGSRKLPKAEWYSKPMKKFSDEIDIIYSISLPERLDNVEEIQSKLWSKENGTNILKAFDKHNVDIEDSNLSSGRIACNISHMQMINDFLNSDHSTAMFFEDDISINDIENIKDELNKFVRKVNRVDPNWDAIYTGYCYESRMDEVADEVLKLKTPRCRHAYILKRHTAEVILKNAFPLTDSPGDEEIANLFYDRNLNVYGPKKQLFIQNIDNYGTTIGNYDLKPQFTKKASQRHQKIDHYQSILPYY